MCWVVRKQVCVCVSRLVFSGTHCNAVELKHPVRVRNLDFLASVLSWICHTLRTLFDTYVHIFGSRFLFLRKSEFIWTFMERNVCCILAAVCEGIKTHICCARSVCFLYWICKYARARMPTCIHLLNNMFMFTICAGRWFCKAFIYTEARNKRTTEESMLAYVWFFALNVRRNGSQN